MSTPTVGLALITRDEKKTLPGLLASIEGAFDQVVLVDTGSRDGTIGLFRKWATAERKRNPAFRFEVDHFKWVDDFSAARNRADSLLDTDWNVWADADDEIRGADMLRQLAAQASPQLVAYMFSYDYARDHHGNCTCELIRERMVRRGAGTWDGRVHECQMLGENPQIEQVDPRLVRWHHRKEGDEAYAEANQRNSRILEAWHADESENPRVLAFLGAEALARKDFPDAEVRYRGYLALETGWTEERAQVHRRLGMALIAQGRYDEAIDVALQAVALMPAWPDSYLTLAEAANQKGEWDKAAEWAQQVITRGQPQSMMILNPRDYDLQPRLMLANALGGMNRLDEAIAVAEQALAIVPDHPELRQQAATWHRQRTRAEMIQTWVSSAHRLLAQDEQLKALTLLEDTVPSAIYDAREIVAMRSQLREHVRPLMDAPAEAYADGGPAPEYGVPDDEIMERVGPMSRARFLLAGIGDQLGLGEPVAA